ncbi:hypothetical protein L1049_025775 [Liquidambar formosana]|uniref:Uncharacterized protein n=1 Tax=Liquidambar formosana TaxID=63359 RepID=A0AAP0NFP3_LIQFO
MVLEQNPSEGMLGAQTEPWWGAKIEAELNPGVLWCCAAEWRAVGCGNLVEAVKWEVGGAVDGNGCHQGGYR